MTKLRTLNKKIEESVVSGYKKIETGAVSRYRKIEDAFVMSFLADEGESLEQAKARVLKEQQEIAEKNRRNIK